MDHENRRTATLVAIPKTRAVRGKILVGNLFRRCGDGGKWGGGGHTIRCLSNSEKHFAIRLRAHRGVVKIALRARHNWALNDSHGTFESADQVNVPPPELATVMFCVAGDAPPMV